MNDRDVEHAVEVHKRIGTVLLWLGTLMAVLMILDRSGLGLLSLPGFWYRSRSLHLVVCLGLFGGGAFLLRSRPDDSDSLATAPEQPVPDVPLFESVRFYSRANCSLCDEARELLSRYQHVLPPIEFVDIEGQPELEEQHGEWIPVVEIEGRIRFRGRVDPVLLDRLIQARRPVDSEPDRGALS